MYTYQYVVSMYVSACLHLQLEECFIYVLQQIQAFKMGIGGNICLNFLEG